MTNFAHYLEFILDSNSNLHASISHFHMCSGIMVKLLCMIMKHEELCLTQASRWQLAYPQTKPSTRDPLTDSYSVGTLGIASI